MKKTARILIGILTGFIILIIIAVFTIPVIFKEKIKEKVVQTINESINARADFKDYHLGFFRSFPNLSFSLTDFSVAGIDEFENDTLLSSGSVSLIFNLASLFSKTGYEVKSVNIEGAVINTVILKDGKANWDIMIDSTEDKVEEETTSDLKIFLQRVEINNSSFSYVDYASDIMAYLNRISGSMNGDLTADETNLKIKIEAGEIDYLMDGIKYLNRITGYAEMNLKADLDSMKFQFDDAYLKLNDLKVNFKGMAAMPFDDIETNLAFSTEKGSLKTFLSIIPAFFMNDFQNLQTEGEFILDGRAVGIYSDADSTLPDISLNLNVINGNISYPALPEQIKNINLDASLFLDGKEMDRSIVNLERFHMEVGGNPFDMKLVLRTPESDPDFDFSANGKIDLTALSKALPEDSLDMSGLIDITLNMAGRLSMIEKQQYDRFKASGNLRLDNLFLLMPDYPEVSIYNAEFEFAPSFAALLSSNLKIGSKSDFNLMGRLENYIPYLLKNETIKGNLSLQSKLIDFSDIMYNVTADSTSESASLSIIQVPENINFDFAAYAEEVIYNKIKVNNVKGHLIIKDGTVNVNETGMNLLGGKITLDAQYDTRDTLRPFMDAQLDIVDIGVKDAFLSFNTIQKLAPTAKGINGKVGIQLKYSSQFRNDFMPVISTINGSGKLRSDEVTLLESAVYNNMKEVLKLGSNYSNTFKNINVSFNVNNGRIFVSPFDTKAGNIKMNISGDQGLDQTINYVIKTEIPRSDLGSSVNSLIDNLSVQAAAFGLAFKPSDIIKVNVKVTGTFLKPVVTPFFGSDPGGNVKPIGETAKQAVVETVSEKIDEAKEKVQTELEIQADKLIKEAEGKAQQLRDEAEKAAVFIRQEADNQAQKLIKEAESKGPVAKLAAQKAADTVKKEADKRANQLLKEADEKAFNLIEEAKSRREELLKKM